MRERASIREAAKELVGSGEGEIPDALAYMFRGGYNAGALNAIEKLALALGGIKADLEKSVADEQEFMQ